MIENNRIILSGIDINNPNTIKITNVMEKPSSLGDHNSKVEQRAESVQSKTTFPDLTNEEGLKNIGNAINGRNPWEY